MNLRIGELVPEPLPGFYMPEKRLFSGWEVDRLPESKWDPVIWIVGWIRMELVQLHPELSNKILQFQRLTGRKEFTAERRFIQVFSKRMCRLSSNGNIHYLSTHLYPTNVLPFIGGHVYGRCTFRGRQCIENMPGFGIWKKIKPPFTISAFSYLWLKSERYPGILFFSKSLTQPSWITVNNSILFWPYPSHKWIRSQICKQIFTEFMTTT